jgi:hypothetical protein
MNSETDAVREDANEMKNMREQDTEGQANTATMSDTRVSENQEIDLDRTAQDGPETTVQSEAVERGAVQELKKVDETGAVENPGDRLSVVLCGEAGKTDVIALKFGTQCGSKLLQHDCVREFQVSNEFGNICLPVRLYDANLTDVKVSNLNFNMKQLISVQTLSRLYFRLSLQSLILQVQVC